MPVLGGQDAWEWQFPRPQGNDLNSVFVTAPGKAVAVGSGGAMLITSDKGQHWNLLPSLGPGSLWDVHFPVPDTGYAVGDSGWILKSTDGGSHWTPLLSHRIEHLYSVHFANARTGYAAGDAGVIIKTSDGGLSWKMMDGGRANFLWKVFALDSANVWATGNEGGKGMILHSADGGATWAAQLQDTLLTVRDIHFRDRASGYAVGDFNGYLKTSDGGAHWTLDASICPWGCLGIDFPEADTGYAMRSDSPVVHKTVDGGVNWSTDTLPGARNAILQAIGFGSSGDGYIVGVRGQILTASSASPRTWQSTETLPGLRDLVIAAAGVAYAVGDEGTIVKSSDSGRTWLRQESGTDSGLKAISMLDKNTGYAVGRQGTLLRTRDGDHWTSLPGPAFNWEGVAFPQADTGWVVGWYLRSAEVDGVIRKSDDGGLTWQDQGPPLSVRIECVRFLNTSTGYAGGEGGTILKTKNGGASWVTQKAGSGRITDLYFFNADTGFAVEEASAVHGTVNGGATWTSKYKGPAYPTNIAFADRKIGFAGGYNGFIKTTDGGETWSPFTQVYPTSVSGLDFRGMAWGLAVTSLGGILRYIPDPDLPVTKLSGSGRKGYGSRGRSPFGPGESRVVQAVDPRGKRVILKIGGAPAHMTTPAFPIPLPAESP
ncbi:MAG: hypothetical protein JF616_01165 [Fibrobacteres bacterium]|nr:hypothetical protein [Fibrobacterota bacterium]